jgi:hypothetical protein
MHFSIGASFIVTGLTQRSIVFVYFFGSRQLTKDDVRAALVNQSWRATMRNAHISTKYSTLKNLNSVWIPLFAVCSLSCVHCASVMIDTSWDGNTWHEGEKHLVIITYSRHLRLSSQEATKSSVQSHAKALPKQQSKELHGALLCLPNSSIPTRTKRLVQNQEKEFKAG